MRGKFKQLDFSLFLDFGKNVREVQAIELPSFMGFVKKPYEMSEKTDSAISYR